MLSASAKVTDFAQGTQNATTSARATFTDPVVNGGQFGGHRAGHWRDDVAVSARPCHAARVLSEFGPQYPYSLVWVFLGIDPILGK